MNTINTTLKPKSNKNFKLFSRLQNKKVKLYTQHPSLSKFVTIKDSVVISLMEDSSKHLRIIFGILPNGKEGYMIFTFDGKLLKENISGRTSSLAKSNAVEYEHSVILEDALLWIENKFDDGVDMIMSEHE